MGCCSVNCGATARHFNADVAEGDRHRYKSKGLDKRARRLVDAVVRAGIEGASLLDVGSGLGLVSLELLRRGAATATLADASPAYLQAARAEAIERGLGDRLRFVEGDFAVTTTNIPPADVVVLDRAVCCYPDWRSLLTAAGDRCRRVLAMTYPRNGIDIRAVLGFENLRRRWSGDAFRAFVHPPSAMDGLLRERGFRRISKARTFFWHIDVYVRDRLSS
jgi:magnesium-protoporphyrin O-methyltransferase